MDMYLILEPKNTYNGFVNCYTPANYLIYKKNDLNYRNIIANLFKNMYYYLCIYLDTIICYF